MSKSAITSTLAYIAASYPTNGALPSMENKKNPASRKNKQKKEAAKSLTHQAIEPTFESAQTFTEALKNAGKKEVPGRMVPVIDQEKARADERVAIASFIGYDPRQAHGTQLDQARRTALRMIRPVTPKEYHRGLPATTSGYVSGLPNSFEKELGDLQARERMTVELMTNHVRDAQISKDTTQRTFSAGQAALEKARLVRIRKDLKQFNR